MFITQNPNIDMESEQQPNLYYLDDGVCFFKCIGDPENVIRANKGSIASSTNGSLYIKTTDSVASGWVAIGSGGGAPSLNQNQIAFGDASNLMTSSSKLQFDNASAFLRVGESGASGSVRIYNTNGRYASIASGTMSSSKNFVLPIDYGTAGQAIVTDGFGNWSYGDFISATLPGSDKQVFYNDGGSLNAAVGFEYYNAGSSNVVITPTTGAYTGVFIKEDLSTGDGLANGIPCLLTLQVLDDNTYYAVAYKNDASTMRYANYLRNSGELAFEAYDINDDYWGLFWFNGAAGQFNVISYTAQIATTDIIRLDRYGAGYKTLFLGVDEVSDIGYLTRTANTPQLSLNASGQVQLHPIGISTGNTNELRFLELTANGSNYTGFKSPDSLTGNVMYTLPVADGTSGQVLSTNASGVLSWITASASLTATQIGFGNGSNLLSGSTKFIWNDSTRELSFVTGSSNGSIYFNTSVSTANIKFQSSAGIAGSQAGLIFPFIGGDQTSGHGLWWSDGTYLNTSRFNLQLGFNFQGASASTSPVKIRKSTGTSSDGTIVFAFYPNSGFFDLQPYGVSAGETSSIRFSELASNGINYIEFKAPDALTANTTFTLPDGAGTAGSPLITNGSNTLSWSTAIKVDNDSTAGNTRFFLYDVDNATLERVTVGIADSGGVGFKLLRIPN